MSYLSHRTEHIYWIGLCIFTEIDRGNLLHRTEGTDRIGQGKLTASYKIKLPLEAGVTDGAFCNEGMEVVGESDLICPRELTVS